MKTYQIMGSQELLMFEIDYFDWEENVSGNLMKIREGMYTEREPFKNILCFCEIFSSLFWSYEICEKIFSEILQQTILGEVKATLGKANLY